MSNYWILLSTAILVIYSVVASSPNGVCPLQHIQGKSSFNVSRYLGLWYEMNWLPPWHEPPEMQWTDVTQAYRPVSDGVITGAVLYRSPLSPDGCQSSNFTLEMTAQAGKLIKVKQSGSNPYWVMDTDYTSYALVYECFDVNVSVDGTCKKPFLSIWSRTTNMNPAPLGHLRTIAEDQLCLNLTSLLTAKHDNPCGSTGSAPLQFAETNFLLVALMSVAVKALSP